VRGSVSPTSVFDHPFVAVFDDEDLLGAGAHPASGSLGDPSFDQDLAGEGHGLLDERFAEHHSSQRLDSGVGVAG